MVHFVGRTAARGGAMHLVTVFVVNDAGTWMLRRPQDDARGEVPELVRLAREQRFVELDQRSRVALAEGRADVPRASSRALSKTAASTRICWTIGRNRRTAGRL